MDGTKRKKRGAKAIELSEIRCEKIYELMDREGINRKILAERVGKTPSTVSRSLKQMKISDDFLNRIIDAFPGYRKEWFFGYDDYATDNEKKAAEERAERLSASVLVLHDALREVCARERIEDLDIDNINISELLLIQAQLKDYAVSLMWQYVKYRKNSYFWSFLDQVNEKEKE